MTKVYTFQISKPFRETCWEFDLEEWFVRFSSEHVIRVGKIIFGRWQQTPFLESKVLASQSMHGRTLLGDVFFGRLDNRR
jgi:hypothetical protein